MARRRAQDPVPPAVLPPQVRVIGPMRSGESGTTWLVDAGGQRRVLRLFPPTAGAPAAGSPAHRARLLRHLRGAGLPVAEVVAVAADHLLLEFLPGHPGGEWYRARCGEAQLGAAFALLARLHALPAADLPPMPLPEDAWRPLLARKHAEWAPLRREAARALAEFRGRPRALCHGDFHPGNMLFQAGRTSGLLDFETAQFTHPEFDLAYGVLTFCARWPRGVLHQRHVRRALAAYGAIRPPHPHLLRALFIPAALALYDWCAALPQNHPRRAIWLRHYGDLLTRRPWRPLLP